MSDITNIRARVSGPRLRGVGLGLVLLAAVAVGAGPAAAQQSGEAVRTFIERNDELLMWARDLVAETESDQARRVLRQAAGLHQRSVDILDGGRPVEALAVGRRARDAIWHAVRLAREAMGLEERIRIRAERFRDLHQDLSERARAGNNEQALQFLERARQQADRARELVRQGDFQLAWNLLDQAGDLMARAARVLAADAGPERLDAELERARAAIARAREQLGDGARPHQLDLLAEAEDAWQRADAARAAGQPGQALQLAGLATRLARRAATGPDGPPSGDPVRRQLDLFDGRAERIGEAVRQSGSEEARRRYDEALAQRERAAAHHRAGETDLALRRIRAAHDLLDQAADLAR